MIFITWSNIITSSHPWLLKQSTSSNTAREPSSSPDLFTLYSPECVIIARCPVLTSSLQTLKWYAHSHLTCLPMHIHNLSNICRFSFCSSLGHCYSFLAHLDFSPVSLCDRAVSEGEWVSESVSQWVCQHFSHYHLNQTHDLDETLPQTSYLMPNEGLLTTSKSVLINVVYGCGFDPQI